MKPKGPFPGIYETDYGNCAFVNAKDVKQAFDLDMGEWIPIELVTDVFLRAATENDTDCLLDEAFGDMEGVFDEEDDVDHDLE